VSLPRFCGITTFKCMNTPHIRSVDLTEDGLIVTYDDSSSAFYHESVLQAHLRCNTRSEPRPRRAKSVKKPAGRAEMTERTSTGTTNG
jgi:hypothetical protein